LNPISHYNPIIAPPNQNPRSAADGSQHICTTAQILKKLKYVKDDPLFINYKRSSNGYASNEFFELSFFFLSSTD
jgi:hypothetical protein